MIRVAGAAEGGRSPSAAVQEFRHTRSRHGSVGSGAATDGLLRRLTERSVYG